MYCKTERPWLSSSLLGCLQLWLGIIESVHAYQQPNERDGVAAESVEIWADRQATVRDAEQHAEPIQLD